MDKERVKTFYESHLTGVRVTRGGDGLVAFCPFHDDASGGKPSASIDLERGLFKCFSPSCGKNFNIITFSRALGIGVPSWAGGGKNWAFIYSKILKNSRIDAEDYLYSRGVPYYYINYLKEENLFGQDMYDERMWLVFPIYKDGGISGINKIEIGGSDKKIHGALMGSYWIDTVFDWAKPIIMVEGILNAVSINSIGGDYQALAILSAENSDIPAQYLKGTVYYMFDNDAAGIAIARKYARACNGNGKKIQWPPGLRKGFDPNDLLKVSPQFEDDVASLLQNSIPINEWSDAQQTFKKLRSAKASFSWS